MLSTNCDIGTIATNAKNAATAAGINLASYAHYVYFLGVVDSGCSFSGASDVGGTPSESWINATTDIHVINHELGHAFGLWHSHLYNCGTSSVICSTPDIVEYGDLIDTMGVPQTASFDYNAFQHSRLGWLNFGSLPTIQTVTTSGTYTITPLEIVDSGPKALKILKGTDPTTGANIYYYLEQRQAVGFDAPLTQFPIGSAQTITTGILFHVGTDNDGNSSDLLDMTPSSPTFAANFDPTLVVGQTYTDSAAGVNFTPLSGSISCSAHPLAASYTAAQTSSVNIHVTDSLGNVVSGASVTQVLRKTNGATSAQSCSTNSGGDAFCTYKIRNNDALGTWQATETVTQGTLSTSCNTNFLVN